MEWNGMFPFVIVDATYSSYCFTFASFFQGEVLFATWKSIFENKGSLLEKTTPIYSFSGKDVLKDDDRW